MGRNESKWVVERTSEETVESRGIENREWREGISIGHGVVCS
jgi:hypothetical protein